MVMVGIAVDAEFLQPVMDNDVVFGQVKVVQEGVGVKGVGLPDHQRPKVTVRSLEARVRVVEVGAWFVHCESGYRTKIDLKFHHVQTTYHAQPSLFVWRRPLSFIHNQL